MALVLKNFSVRKCQRQGKLRCSLKQVASASVRAHCQGKILAVADGKIDLDWAQLRNRCQHGLGIHKVANLSCRLPCNAADQRPHLGETEIEVRRGHSCLRRLHRCFRLSLLLDLVVELASGNRMRLRQRRVAIHVDLRERKLRLRLPKLALCLFKRRLKRPRIDLEQYLALFHLRAFAIILADQVAVRLWLYLSIHVAVECAHPFAGQRHIARLHLHHTHFHCGVRIGR